VIVGAGGHGRELLDVVDAINKEVPTFMFLGFLDDHPDPHLNAVHALGREVLGPVQMLDTIEAEYLIGIGSPNTRSRVDALASRAERVAAIAVHPAASLGANVSLAAGCVVCAGARLTTNIRAGRHVHVNLNATLAHDCTVGDYVTINPGACVSGNVTLGRSVAIGAGAVVLQGLTIGDGATVGAAAAVVTNVPEGTVVVGVPAKPLQRNR
jgi:sugar O-acyltransferase (sialic acid O-acetyltransferase NeuD family)